MTETASDQGGPSNSSTSTALRNWELSNCIDVAEKIYRYDLEEQQAILCVKPWDKDPHYFKEVKISAIALLKMVMHARSGGNLEIMGVIQGKIDANTIIIMDSFALPVDGTETTVNAQEEAYEYMSIYSESCEPVGRFDKVVGWYHSHPGYGCWLSGIDVATQALHQQFQEPFVAIVIDPIRTISAGKVDLGAFRVYPKGYNPPNEPSSEYQSIPLNKIEDFGVHCKQYYQLEVTYFKSSLDVRLLESLWNTYWATTLSSNLLLTNAAYARGQVRELSRKMEKATEKLRASCRTMPSIHRSDDSTEKSSTRIIKDGVKLCDEVLPGLAVQAIKRCLFNMQ